MNAGANGTMPDNASALKIYAFYKQIHVGPCNKKAPSKLKVVERAKYDAWKALGNMSKEDAQKEVSPILSYFSSSKSSPKSTQTGKRQNQNYDII